MRLIMVAGVIALGLAAATPVLAQKVVEGAPQTKVDDRPTDLQEIARALQSGDLDGALQRINRYVDRAEFKAQPEEMQRMLLSVRVSIALDLNQPVQALAYARRATGGEWAGADEWRNRYVAAYGARDFGDAAESLITLVGFGQEELEGLNPRVMRGLVLTQIEDLPGGKTLQLRVIDALFDAGWDDEASALWLIGATRAIDAGDVARSGRFASRIVGPGERIVLATDHRFAPVRQASPSVADVVWALDHELGEARRKAVAEPQDLELASTYALRLMLRGRYDEGLGVVDAALRQVDASRDKPGAPEVDPDDYIWALDTRSRIYVHIGRYDEAVADLRRAARRPEGGAMNVSHAINLGNLYVRVDRPEAALESVADIGEGDASPFGLMQAALVRACAQVALGRTAELKASMSWIEAHASDAPDVLGAAALCNGQGDLAAADLIARLDDPDRRGAALLVVQTYMQPPSLTASERRDQELWRSVLAREDVKAAVARAGVVREWPVLSAQF